MDKSLESVTLTDHIQVLYPVESKIREKGILHANC